jgi:hypothetical protein
MLDGWPSQLVRTERCQGPLWRVMCSETCTHRDPLLAGLCIGTRRTVQGLLFPSLTGPTRKWLLLPRLRGPARRKLRAAVVVRICSRKGASARTQQSRLNSAAEQRRAKTALISAGEAWCGSAAAAAGQGHGLGLQRNWQAVSEKSRWAVSGANHSMHGKNAGAKLL